MFLGTGEPALDTSHLISLSREKWPPGGPSGRQGACLWAAERP
ncbi:IQCE isoform 6 [Pan troglodytes]|uniref:IQ motif containing E n=2 Tax=Homininae TaxID=207598 RepID=X5D7Y5_HUMAN|nr:IQ motif containing E isoform B [Homo sapiens]PNI35171.1 IQCE isoform 6 [Pan troglodytes]